MSLLILAIIATALLVYAWKASLTENDKQSEPVQQCAQTLHPEPTNGTTSAKPKTKRLRYFGIKDKGYHVSVWPKDQGIGDCIQFNIAGITYAENIDDYLGESACQLVPQPTNPHDPNAIEIVARDGHHLGFVPKDMTTEVRRHTHLPASCYVYIGKNRSEGKYYTCCYFVIDYDNLP